MQWAVTTTLLPIAVTIFTTMHLPFSGDRVLRDDYISSKTFKDMHEDYAIKRVVILD